MSNENLQDVVDRSIERVRRYADGAALIFENAEALYNEAQMLGQAGSFARATVLHQISMEECAKIDTLGAVATGILTGDNVDERRIANAFRNHKAKNHANAYFATSTEDEKAARARGDWKASSEAFKKFQRKFHAEVNTIKNAALYVDFQDGQFTAPKDEIDEATAVVFMHLNGSFLKRSSEYVRLLRRMASEPDRYTDLGKHIIERTGALRTAGDLDPERIGDTLMEELLTGYASKMAED